jgi:hypothetical protein
MKTPCGRGTSKSVLQDTACGPYMRKGLSDDPPRARYHCHQLVSPSVCLQTCCTSNTSVRPAASDCDAVQNLDEFALAVDAIWSHHLHDGARCSMLHAMAPAMQKM